MLGVLEDKMNNKQFLSSRTQSLVVMEGGIRIKGKLGVGSNNISVIGRVLC